MALLSMALNARGVPAISFTGSQSGIITNDAHSSARIVEVRPFRVEDELARGKVVIVAGYQGVSYKREITTLGRGGSDTTAVALAAALGAEACEIYSDVDGVYSADPRVVPGARRLSEISYDEMQELAEAGAKVLNAQAVEFAKEARHRHLCARLERQRGRDGRPPLSAQGSRPRGGCRERDRADALRGRTLHAGGARRCADAARRARHRRQAAADLPGGDGHRAALVVPLENLHDFGAHEQPLAAGGFRFTRGIGAVSAIGTGINATFGNVRQALAALAEQDVAVLGLSTSSFRISVLVERTLARRPR